MKWPWGKQKSELRIASKLLSDVGFIPLRTGADSPTLHAQALAAVAQARYARMLVWWTAALVLATIGLVGATIALIIATKQL